MTKQAELRGLLEQVVNAEGLLSNDKLDALTRATFGKAATFDDWGMLNDAINKGDMNAALAFKERVLPGWGVLMAYNGETAVCDVHTKPLGDPSGKWPGHAKHTTPALALVAAVLKALIEQESE